MENNNINEFKIKLIKGKYYYLKDKYLKAQKDGYLPLSIFKDSEMGQFTEEEILASIQTALKEKTDLSIQDSEKLLIKATNLYNKYKYFYQKNILENKLNEANLVEKILTKLHLFLFYKNNEKIIIRYFFFILPTIILIALNTGVFGILIDDILNVIANFINSFLSFNQTIIERSNLYQLYTSLILAYNWAASIFMLILIILLQDSIKSDFTNLEQARYEINFQNVSFANCFKEYILIFLASFWASFYFLLTRNIDWEKFSKEANRLEGGDINASYIQYAHPLFTVIFFGFIILLGQHTKIKNSYFKTYKKIYALKP